MGLRQELIEQLETATGRRTPVRGPAIIAALGRLDELLRTHRSDLPPRLAHFLEGRSYLKALHWLGENPGPLTRDTN